MTVIETAKITSKGQVTIPNRIRKILHLDDGSTIAFGLSKEGVLIVPCKVTVKSPYSPQEWVKIEKLASVKGKIYKSLEKAKRHISVPT